MKFYPHSKIKTDNLPTLLLAARATSVLGYIFSLLTIFLWVSSIFLGPRTMYGEPNSPILSVTWNGARGMAWLFSAGTVSTALFCFIVGGLCAAVVSFEYKYTKS